MPFAAAQPNLRLVGGHDSREGRSWREIERARLQVIKENRIAAHAPGLHPNDPRWVLAMQTQARLQGATLTPERRDKLMRNGRRLGLRPFEANLVIAIVQDQARTGLHLPESGPALSMVQPVAAAQRNLAATCWPKWIAALAGAAALATIVIRWLAER
jgi:hypothetical protein